MQKESLKPRRQTTDKKTKKTKIEKEKEIKKEQKRKRNENERDNRKKKICFDKTFRRENPGLKRNAN